MFRRSSPVPRATLALAAALAAASTAPVAADAQGTVRTASASAAHGAPANGLRYTFTMNSSEEDATRGTMTVLGDRARMDIAKGSSAKVSSSGGATITAKSDGGRDWFLLTQNGRRITIVDPEERNYQEMDAESFTGLVGTVMRVMDKFMTLEVQEPTVSVQRLGNGGQVAGRPTERWAVVQEFTMNVGMLGKTKQELHRIVTDYWIAPGLSLPDNPLFELVSRGEAALTQGDAGYVARVARARAMLPKGAAMRVVVTSASSELESGEVKPPKVRRMEITGIAPATVDRATLQVPSGYQRVAKGKGLSLDL